METINLGRVAFVYKGDYSAVTTYNKMDVVFDGESSFVSQIDNNVGNPLVNGLNWKYLSRGNNLELQEAKQDIATLETDVNSIGEAVNSVVVVEFGVNILDPSTIDNGVDDKGTYLNRTTGIKNPSASNVTCVSDYMEMPDEGLFVIGLSTSGVNGWSQYSEKSETSYISGGISNPINKVAGAKYIRFCLIKLSDKMVSVGTTPIEYVPWEPPKTAINPNSIIDKSILRSKLVNDFFIEKLLYGKQILILGDSSMTSDKWPIHFDSIKHIYNFTLINGAEGGKTWNSDVGSPLDHWINLKNSITVDGPIVCIGCGGVGIGNFTQGYDFVFERCYANTSEMLSPLDKAIETIKTIKRDFPKSRIFLQNNWLTNTGYTYENAIIRHKLKEFYEALCDYFGCALVDITRGGNISTYTENYTNDNGLTYPYRYATNDGTHITNEPARKWVANLWLGCFIKYLYEF